jgi:hypothetical protein
LLGRRSSIRPSAAADFHEITQILAKSKKEDEAARSYDVAIVGGAFMAISGVGPRAAQFTGGTVAQAAPQTSFAQQSKELSDAVVALQAPAILAIPARTSSSTQMATLCLVQPGDNATGAGSGALSTALAAYATVFTD